MLYEVITVFMSESEWQFERIKSNNPAIRFYSTSEMVEDRSDA